MGARRAAVAAVAERYRSAKRAEKGRILDELCATTGWHRKHAVRVLRQRKTLTQGESRERGRRYDATIKDALTALWEASDRVCGKRLKVMIPTLLAALERHGRLKLGQADRDRVLVVSAATVDRLLSEVKVTASGGKRRRAGFYSAIRREGARFRSEHSTIGKAHRRASARSTWLHMVARRWQARSSRR